MAQSQGLRSRFSSQDADAAQTRPPFDAIKAEKAARQPMDGRLSETNRGLRMILIAAVAIVLISWGGTVLSRYIRYMEVEQLVSADQDALRVMCAVKPPTERDLGWMHICESAALGEAKTVEAKAD